VLGRSTITDRPPIAQTRAIATNRTPTGPVRGIRQSPSTRSRLLGQGAGVKEEKHAGHRCAGHRGKKPVSAYGRFDAGWLGEGKDPCVPLGQIEQLRRGKAPSV